MTLFPDNSPQPPAKPNLTATERRARQADRLMRIRFRMMIGLELEERGITTPAAIGVAFGMDPAEATALLNRHQWQEGDVMLLEAVAARLKLQVPELGPLWP